MKINENEIWKDEDPTLGYKWFDAFSKMRLDKEPKNNFYIAERRSFTSEENKLFIFDAKYNYLFVNTIPKFKNQDIKMPFNQIFLCSKIDLGEYGKIISLQINCCNVDEIKENRLQKKWNIKFGDIKEIININSPIYKDEKITEFITKINIHTGDVYFNENSKNKNKENIYICNKVRDYIINFLLFMNEPRVVTHIVSSNNKRRERKGLIPLPSQIITKITPELREYINIHYNSHSKLGYSFDVRGHWRILKHERYKENIGKRIWIPPHIKGEGVKAPQIFKVCEK